MSLSGSGESVSRPRISPRRNRSWSRYRRAFGRKHATTSGRSETAREKESRRAPRSHVRFAGDRRLVTARHPTASRSRPPDGSCGPQASVAECKFETDDLSPTSEQNEIARRAVGLVAIALPGRTPAPTNCAEIASPPPRTTIVAAAAHARDERGTPPANVERHRHCPGARQARGRHELATRWITGEAEYAVDGSVGA